MMETNIITTSFEYLDYILGISQHIDVSFFAWLLWLWWPFIVVSKLVDELILAS